MTVASETDALSTIQFLQAKETYEIRREILRPGLPLEESRFAGDEDETTFHIGVFRGGRLVCVASFFREGHREFPGAARPYRLRGMATRAEWQGRGAGAEAIAAGLAGLGERGCDLLWCNARLGAVGFYRKLGFLVRGPQFDLPGIGPHVVMFRQLTFTQSTAGGSSASTSGSASGENSSTAPAGPGER